ncbi:MAG: NADH-quinone oxidoreductase subunit K [Pseudomonadota bacterium]|nr:NADH-quinone oxidoreductase subunit K [Pseudomonadota bacterium]
MGFDFETVLYAGAIGLVAVGLGGLVMVKDLFRVILALAIAEAGANLLLVLAGYRGGAVAPIVTEATAGQSMVDPVPQALVLTAIVIGVGVQALVLAIAIRVQRAYGTLDLREIRDRLEQDLAAQQGVTPPVSEHEPAGGRPLPRSEASPGAVLSHD